MELIIKTMWGGAAGIVNGVARFSLDPEFINFTADAKTCPWLLCYPAARRCLAQSLKALKIL